MVLSAASRLLHETRDLVRRPGTMCEISRRVVVTEPLGTDVIAVHDRLPSGVSPGDNEVGWRSSLDRLAALVEPQASEA